MADSVNQREAGVYSLGYSDTEAARLDKQHVFLKKVFDDKLVHIPADAIKEHQGVYNVLDIGTGTGIFCHDAAAELRAAGLEGELQFVGTDIAENPLWEAHGSNEEAKSTTKFCIVDMTDDDAMLELVVKYGKFDLIHARLLGIVLKAEQWEPYFERITKLLKPGGYFQTEENDFVLGMSLRKDRTAAEAMTMVHACYRSIGADPSHGPFLGGWMRKAGFGNVRDTAYYVEPFYTKKGQLIERPLFNEWCDEVMVLLRGLFLRIRKRPDYAQLLDQLPQEFRDTAPNHKPEELLKNEAEYDDMLERMKQVRIKDPLFHVVFRMVIGQNPGSVPGG